ncbi:hypothetical protein RND71_030716 [Anisodus tanguticus]|uniref:Methyltransferase n=1 Tax=Anisodus tanguticus TaxID=243964 RepID=A0AAE1RGX6_9SOLA|nr:hypothetical protein RND71_030716 [Anisodus tanguticus]
MFFNSPQNPSPISVSISPNFNKTFHLSTLINHTQQYVVSIPPPPPPPPPGVQKIGLLDENGVMKNDFVVGEMEYNYGVGNETCVLENNNAKAKFKKFGVCLETKREYVPCLDNVEAIQKLNSTAKGEKYERHCPEKGKGLNCLMPAPRGYPTPIPWYVDLKACITRLPDEGYGANITTWPSRLHYPPERLQSIQLDAYISRKELFRAESRYWKEIIESYVRVLHWKNFKLKNVLDMRAAFGGFAAALIENQLDCWVLNVVPVSGLLGVMGMFETKDNVRGIPNRKALDGLRASEIKKAEQIENLAGLQFSRCEPFDTYPRTCDLLHAHGLFSIERKRYTVTFLIFLQYDTVAPPQVNDGVLLLVK